MSKSRGAPMAGAVGFFSGCVMHEIFPGINRATIRVLAHNGFDVHVPPSQGCCGALQAHSGDLDFARGLARKNVAAFREVWDEVEIDAIVNNSAGCGAAMREAEEWIPGEGEGLAKRAKDVTEFLGEVGMRAPREPLMGANQPALRVCYDDPCHLIHAQRVAAAPRRLLSAIPGIEIVPHRDPDRCCGAAGIYNLTQPTMSREILAAKMMSLGRPDPDVIATGNPGCLLQLKRGVAEQGLSADVLHPIELLDRAYRGGADDLVASR
jgi:glycolate oxidase iron-sulfur subunit